MVKRACIGESRMNNGLPSSHLRQGTSSGMYSNTNYVSQSSMSTMITISSNAESGEYTSRDSLGDTDQAGQNIQNQAISS